ncbi:unnamed protein product, partial [Ectocarpus sp. 12 AP-2014]
DSFSFQQPDWRYAASRTCSPYRVASRSALARGVAWRRAGKTARGWTYSISRRCQWSKSHAQACSTTVVWTVSLHTTGRWLFDIAHFGKQPPQQPNQRQLFWEKLESPDSNYNNILNNNGTRCLYIEYAQQETVHRRRRDHIINEGLWKERMRKQQQCLSIYSCTALFMATTSRPPPCPEG